MSPDKIDARKIDARCTIIGHVIEGANATERMAIYGLLISKELQENWCDTKVENVAKYISALARCVRFDLKEKGFEGLEDSAEIQQDEKRIVH